METMTDKQALESLVRRALRNTYGHIESEQVLAFGDTRKAVFAERLVESPSFVGEVLQGLEQQIQQHLKTYGYQYGIE